MCCFEWVENEKCGKIRASFRKMRENAWVVKKKAGKRLRRLEKGRKTRVRCLEKCGVTLSSFIKGGKTRASWTKRRENACIIFKMTGERRGKIVDAHHFKRTGNMYACVVCYCENWRENNKLENKKNPWLLLHKTWGKIRSSFKLGSKIRMPPHEGRHL